METQAGALTLFLRGEEGVEDLFQVIAGDAGTRILDRCVDKPVRAGGGERQRALPLHGLHGIGDEVDEDLQELVRIAPHRRYISILRDDLDLIYHGRPPRHFDGLVQRVVEVDVALFLPAGAPGVRIQVLYDVRDAPTRFDDVLDIVADDFRPRLLQQVLREAGDRVERIVDLVSDARGQGADGRQLLRLDELVAQVLFVQGQLPDQERGLPTQDFGAWRLVLDELRPQQRVASHGYVQICNTSHENVD